MNALPILYLNPTRPTKPESIRSIFSFWLTESQAFRASYGRSHNSVSIELFAVTNSVSRRMMSLSSGSCLSKRERVKGSSVEAVNIVDNGNFPTGFLTPFALLPLTRFFCNFLPVQTELSGG
jgi:hypothetical protein